MSEIATIILAAGRGVRFGAGPESSKMLAMLDGKPLIRWVAEVALASRCAEVIVVTGHAAQAVGAALESLPLRLVPNPSFSTGMASSLRAGIAAVASDKAGALVLLGDMPFVSVAIVDALIERFDDARSAARGRPEAVVPVHGGIWGNPVLLNRSLFASVMALDGDQGARKLLRDRDIVTLPLSDEAITFDIDTPAILAVAAKRLGERPRLVDGTASTSPIHSVASAAHEPGK